MRISCQKERGFQSPEPSPWIRAWSLSVCKKKGGNEFSYHGAFQKCNNIIANEIVLVW